LTDTVKKVGSLKRANCWLRFTDGSQRGSTPRDLKEAKALLQELTGKE
jgi:hypothetical protein